MSTGMIQILPSVLATTDHDYQQKIEKIEESGDFEDGFLHVDFADNEFVPNQTVGTDVLKKFPTNLHVEAHLMVSNPDEWIHDLVEAGVERIIVHIETLKDEGLVKRVKSEGVEAGLAIKLETPVAKLEPFVDTIDTVLVMSIHPGFSGQEFLKEGFEKIQEVSQLRLNKKAGFKIEVDGGVTATLIPELGKLGVDGVIMASHLLEGDIDENLEEIWEKFEESNS